MDKLTLQIYLAKQWQDAAEIVFEAPEQGHLGATRLDYLAPYVLQQLDDAPDFAGQLSCRYPVDFTSYQAAHWPAFLLDLLPGGEGRRRWLNRLQLPQGRAGEFELLRHAAANPPGNLRIKEAALLQAKFAQALPDAEGRLLEAAQHPGFCRDEIIAKQEHFIEYAYQLGAAVAGATDVQGEAPKFLMVEDVNHRWHAEGAIADAQVKKHWIVKFPRGKTPADMKVLHNEAKYLEVARRFGVEVGEALTLVGDALFIPRFDRRQKPGQTQRIAMESLFSLAGISRFGEASSHEILCCALMNQLAPEQRFSTALEYLQRDLLNVVLGNTDNHGRNTAVLRAGNRLYLSPLFDFAPMYLDPEGIARVTRWQGEREQAGRPQWAAVVEFFKPWLNTKALKESFFSTAIKHLNHLVEAMREENIDADIIDRRALAISNNLKQLNLSQDAES